MKRSFTTLCIALAVVAFTGCDNARDGADTTLADTSTMRGMDTVNIPTAVPTTDTIVRSRDVDVDVDTIRGDARTDTVRRRTP